MSTRLEVEGLTKHFPVADALPFTRRQVIHALDDVDLVIEGGKTLGLVGESGSGKSTLGRLILRLIEPTRGAVRFDGKNIYLLKGSELQDLRRRIQIVFQDPDSSLDPRATIGRTLREAVARSVTPRTRARLLELLEMFGLDETHIVRYPQQLSGGQKQRVGIARALAVNPHFIVADEPVSALDVSIQAQILNLLSDLQRRLQLTYLFITHDLSVVRHIADRVAVMYLGNIMEIADTEELFSLPAHPYTQALLSAVPDPDPDVKRIKAVLKGEVPSPIHPPPGCRFHPRCPLAEAVCRQQKPVRREIKPNHQVACHLAFAQKPNAGNAAISEPYTEE